MSEENKWYVLRVLSGKERKVKEYLESEIDRSGWQSIILQVFVPTEKVYTIRNGKKVIKEKNFFPGYVMVETFPGVVSPDILQEIRNVPGVINFLGDNHPTPLRKAEVNRILGTVDEMSESGVSMNEPFIIGETVKITDGPFNDFFGVIEEVMEEKKKLKVIVKIFGRRTPVELNFVQVEKQS